MTKQHTNTFKFNQNLGRETTLKRLAKNICVNTENLGLQQLRMQCREK